MTINKVNFVQAMRPPTRNSFNFMSYLESDLLAFIKNSGNSQHYYSMVSFAYLGHLLDEGTGIKFRLSHVQVKVPCRMFNNSLFSLFHYCVIEYKYCPALSTFHMLMLVTREAIKK